MDYGFSISFPAEPKPNNSFSNTNLSHVCLVAKPDKFSSFSLWAILLPATNNISEKQADALLDIWTKNVLNLGKASPMGIFAIKEPKLLREQPILLKTNQGRESDFEIVNGKVFVRTRGYVVGRRIFVATVMVSIEQTNRSDISVFLNSFQLGQ